MAVPANSFKEYRITTDNKVMKELGLYNFNLDDLYYWITGQRNSTSDTDTYYNMQFIKWSGQTITDPVKRTNDAMSTILGFSSSVDDIDMDLYPDSKKYELSAPRYAQNDSRSMVDQIFTWVASDSTSKNDWETKDYNIDDIELQTFVARYKDRSGKNIEYNNFAISRIIGLNNSFNLPNFDWPDEDQYDAAKKFLADIKLSEEGVKWTQLITIQIPGTDPLVECEIAVDWCLQLERKDAPKRKTQATLISPNITSSKVDEHNRVYEDSDPDTLKKNPVTNTNIARQISAALDVHYNEWLGKFESGTKQVIAVMTTDLPAATPPDDGLLSDPLEYHNDQTGFQVTHGKARPLSMKNNNPTKWSPEWKYLANCEDEDNCDILEVPVQNKLGTDFGKGEMVILNRIGGIWQPSISSSGEAGVAPPAGVGVTKWSFVSMMSNAAHYFVSTDKTRVLYSQYEQGIYDKYYNVANPSNANKINHDGNGYIQLSSFDMMGPNVGGTRAKHALGKVSLHIKNDGTEYDNPISELNPLETTPFFGAYFPDGYAPGDKYNTYTNPLPDTLEFTAIGSKGYQDIGYMNDIPVGTVVFDNDPSTYSNIDGSPFASIAEDTSLRQLPADIALNAHPRSDNGQPLTIVSAIHSMFNVPSNSQDMQTAINNTMADRNKRYMWLSEKTDENSPAFDLNPINNTRVVFRPLKSEVYSVFERIAGVNGGQPTTDPKKRGAWSTKIYNKVTDNEPAISTDVLDRVIFDKGVENGIWKPGVGLKHQKDLAGEPLRASDNSAYPFPFYNRTWPEQQDPRDDAPSSAYGVIGAQCTVTANTSITFNTANVFGMKDYLVVGAQQTVGNGNFFIATLGGKWNSCHGGDSTTYYSRNNTILQARIFHQHPRELTVYDPRFFSVFHFASGIGQDVRTQYMAGGQEVISDNPNKLVAQVWVDLPNTIGYDPRGIGDPDPEKWQFDIQDYTATDFREPTFIGDTSEAATGVKVSTTDVGSSVVKNNTGDSNANPPAAESLVWRDAEHWQINPGYRGKLLPYVGERLTIGIDPADIVIIEGGLDYSDAADTFTTKGGSGAGVSFKPIVDGDGVITGFEIIPDINGNGYDFEPKDFFTQYDLDQANDTLNAAKVKIIESSITSGGTGFKGYVKKGTILTKTGETIAKPVEISPNQSQVTLTPKPPIPRRNGSDPFQDQVTASLTNTVQISTQSDNNEYDIFFHYHNDISHVFHEASLETTLAVCRAQHVDLTVSPA